MADMTELKNAIRIGTVQSVSAEKMTARVKFKDKGGITSGDLHIIKRPVYVIPAMESGTEGQTAKTELQYDYGGELKKESEPLPRSLCFCMGAGRQRHGSLYYASRR